MVCFEGSSAPVLLFKTALVGLQNVATRQDTQRLTGGGRIDHHQTPHAMSHHMIGGLAQAVVRRGYHRRAPDQGSHRGLCVGIQRHKVAPGKHTAQRPVTVDNRDALVAPVLATPQLPTPP